MATKKKAVAKKKTHIMPNGKVMAGAKHKAKGPCWDNHEMVGMKRSKAGKPIPNCVPVKKKK